MVVGRSLPLISPLHIQEGFARLSRGEVFRGGSLDTVLSELAEQAGRLTGIERTSIWAFNRERSELRCLELFQLARQRHSSGDLIVGEHHPAYFDTIRGEGLVVADDAYTHPATQSFAEGYLLKHEITAVLDTAIYVRGELQGLFCLEQVGMRQPWNSVHRLFAQGIANLVTLALVEFEAGEAKRQAESSSERLHAVFGASRDALLLTDESTGVILDANLEAERLFGYRRAELIGKLRDSLHPPATEHGWESGNKPLSSVVRCQDGSALAVEVTAEVAEFEGGRRLVLGIYRPLDRLFDVSPS